MKIRYILIAIVTVVLFNAAGNAMRRSDFQHCRVTSHMTVQECESVTGYTVDK
jgi:hypothetical protein